MSATRVQLLNEPQLNMLAGRYLIISDWIYE